MGQPEPNIRPGDRDGYLWSHSQRWAKEEFMDKRQRQNLLLILAIVILTIGVLVQLYFIFRAE